MVERVHWQIKDGLREREVGSLWLQHLQWVLLGLNAAPKENNGFSSAEMVLGVCVALPGQLQQAGSAEQPSVYPAPPHIRLRSYAELAAGSPPSLLQQACC
jgi:hypothetical protein